MKINFKSSGLLLAVTCALLVFFSCSKDNDDPINGGFIEITLSDNFIGKDVYALMDGKDHPASNISADLNNNGTIDANEKISPNQNGYFIFNTPNKKLKIYGNFSYFNVGTAVTHIDMVKYPQINWLYIGGATTLAVHPNNEVETLVINDNKNATVNVKQFPKLKSINISQSELATIDFSNNPDLQSVNVGANKLTALNFSNNKKLSEITIYLNAINQTNMQALVNSVSNGNSSSATFAVVGEGFSNMTEKNIITKTQVTTLANKGWHVYKVIKNSNGLSYIGYSGS